jgi:hypothetical protein
MDLDQLHRTVSDEIDSYVYPYSGLEIGNPKSNEWITDQLREMRSALVKPYWANVGNEPCVIVADDGRGFYLAYNPRAKEYFLVMIRGKRLIDIGVYGDAVGCFMAR